MALPYFTGSRGLAMPDEASPEVLARRVQELSKILRYGGMSSACAAGLRPVRKVARSKNFGFTDRTGRTRKSIGPVRRYKPATAQRKRGGGAYFRGGGIVGATLEYRFGRQYAYLAPAASQAQGAQLQAFLRQGEKEVTKAARSARRLNYG